MQKTKDKLAFGVEKCDRRYRLRLARYYGLAETIAAYANEQNRDIAILDVGVGRGRTLMYLEIMDIRPHIQIHFCGLDNSDRRLQSVYKREQWQLVKADAERRLPFAEQKFEIVVCEQVLEHLGKLPFVLAEIARVLKPGGIAILGVPSFPPLLYHTRKLLQPIFDRIFHIRRSHVQSFSLRSFSCLVRQINTWKIIEARGFRLFSGGITSFLENYRWWWRCSAFLGRLLPSLATEIQIIAKKVKEPHC